MLVINVIRECFLGWSSGRQRNDKAEMGALENKRPSRQESSREQRGGGKGGEGEGGEGEGGGGGGGCVCGVAVKSPRAGRLK
jgi:hypothetical protein